MTKTILKKKKYRKARLLSEEAYKFLKKEEKQKQEREGG